MRGMRIYARKETFIHSPLTPTLSRKGRGSYIQQTKFHMCFNMITNCSDKWGQTRLILRCRGHAMKGVGLDMTVLVTTSVHIHLMFFFSFRRAAGPVVLWLNGCS